MAGYENLNNGGEIPGENSQPESELPKKAVRASVESLLQCSEDEMDAGQCAGCEGRCRREQTVLRDRGFVAHLCMYVPVRGFDLQRLIYNVRMLQNLTGGNKGGVHLTDCTNASRTMLMNIETLKWDKRLCDFFEIDSSFLPDIRSSSEIYGEILHGPLKGVSISGVCFTLTVYVNR